MDEEYMRQRIADSKKDEVIKFNHPDYGVAYLAVYGVNNGMVEGDIAVPTRKVQSISIDDLIKFKAEIPIGWTSEKNDVSNSTD